MTMDKQEGPDPAQQPRTTKYQVDLLSLDDTLHGDSNRPVRYDSFEEALEYAIEALEYTINVFASLVEQLKAAKRFEDLDLGWHEPFLTRIDDGVQVEPS